MNLLDLRKFAVLLVAVMGLATFGACSSSEEESSGSSSGGSEESQSGGDTPVGCEDPQNAVDQAECDAKDALYN